MNASAALSEATPAKAAPLPRSGLAWAIYEGGRTPYVILVMIYVFTPYVVTSIVGDPIKGQELVSR